MHVRERLEGVELSSNSFFNPLQRLSSVYECGGCFAQLLTTTGKVREAQRAVYCTCKSLLSDEALRSLSASARHAQ